jgi:benzoyl-CoA reductase/2-hydroxyglutaryl-CoA dehydratase subunit BcrC/BadD/HgdB
MGPNVVAELSGALEAPFAALGREPERDRGTVVIAWPSVPVEIVRAAGFRPVVARGSVAPTPAADSVIEADVFPSRLRQLVEAAMTGRLANVAAVVLPRTSDADYKCFLYLRELVRRGVVGSLPPILLFDLLQSSGADVPAYDCERARELLERLATLSGRRLERGDLEEQIALANRARAAARRFDALRRDTPRIAGVEAVRLLGAFWELDPERYVALAAAAVAAIAERSPLRGLRVLLAGAPVDSMTLHAAIEAQGAVVVSELSPLGSGVAGPDVDISAEPLLALVEHYRRESIDARMPVGALMCRMEKSLDGIDAVVVSLPPDDASFGWDYPRLRELFARRSIPHAVLRGDPASSMTATDRERLHALLRDVPQTSGARHG